MRNHYVFDGDDALIEVWHGSNKMYAIIDAAELPRLLACDVCWYASLARKSKAKYYVFAKLRNPKPVTTISLHRIILNDPEGMDVHHRDNDGLNNRRLNLEACAHIENIRARNPNKDWLAYDANMERIAVFKKLVEIGQRFNLSRQMAWRIRTHPLTSDSAKLYWLAVQSEMPELFEPNECLPWIVGPERTRQFYR